MVGYAAANDAVEPYGSSVYGISYYSELRHGGVVFSHQGRCPVGQRLTRDECYAYYQSLTPTPNQQGDRPVAFFETDRHADCQLRGIPGLADTWGLYNGYSAVVYFSDRSNEADISPDIVGRDHGCLAVNADIIDEGAACVCRSPSTLPPSPPSTPPTFFTYTGTGTCADAGGVVLDYDQCTAAWAHAYYESHVETAALIGYTGAPSAPWYNEEWPCGCNTGIWQGAWESSVHYGWIECTDAYGAAGCDRGPVLRWDTNEYVRDHFCVCGNVGVHTSATTPVELELPHFACECPAYPPPPRPPSMPPPPFAPPKDGGLERPTIVGILIGSLVGVALVAAVIAALVGSAEPATMITVVGVDVVPTSTPSYLPVITVSI